MLKGWQGMIEQSRPFLEKADFDYINECIRSFQIAQGRFVKELQNEFCKKFGIRYACASSSGTTALHLALRALNITEGDEVIIPSYTCTSLLDVVNYVNAIPTIVDIDPETFNITCNTIKKKISKRTKAIIVTHTFGFPADIDEILKLGVPVIEDCAHSIGSTYKGRPIGLKGIVSIFSMYATKMLAAGEGGMVCTNDKRIAETLEDLNNPNMRNVYRVRYNYKMSDLTAGLALNQLRKLDFFVKYRRFIAEQYKKHLSLLPVKFQRILPETNPNYYRFIVCSHKANELINFTQAEGVLCDRPIYKPLHHYTADTEFPETDYLWKNAVSIPIYPALKDKEVSKIIDTLTKAFEYYGR